MNPLVYAIVKHGDQKRKGTHFPYVVHPLRAMYILEGLGYEENFIFAALLHDILEDTNTSLENLTDLAGQEVTDLVKSVSKNYSGAFDFMTAPIDSLVVKTADTLSNVEDFVDYRTGVSIDKLSVYLQNLAVATYRLKETKEEKNVSLAEEIEEVLRIFIKKTDQGFKLVPGTLKEESVGYKNNPKFPEIVEPGDIVYLPTELHLSRGVDDISGGKARVFKVDTEANNLKKDAPGDYLLKLEGFSAPYYWKNDLKQQQQKLREKFNFKWARESPDFRPEYNSYENFSAKIISSNDFSEQEKLSCPLGHWSGIPNEAESEAHEDIIDFSCPKCSKMLLVVNYNYLH